ncbi:MAG: hypothetical protein WCP14_05100 [bacterium]
MIYCCEHRNPKPDLSSFLDLKNATFDQIMSVLDQAQTDSELWRFFLNKLSEKASVIDDFIVVYEKSLAGSSEEKTAINKMTEFSKKLLNDAPVSDEDVAILEKIRSSISLKETSLRIKTS